jgi:hypothetical protein
VGAVACSCRTRQVPSCKQPATDFRDSSQRPEIIARRRYGMDNGAIQQNSGNRRYAERVVCHITRGARANGSEGFRGKSFGAIKHSGLQMTRFLPGASNSPQRAGVRGGLLKLQLLPASRHCRGSLTGGVKERADECQSVLVSARSVLTSPARHQHGPGVLLGAIQRIGRVAPGLPSQFDVIPCFGTNASDGGGIVRLSY